MTYKYLVKLLLGIFLIVLMISLSGCEGTSAAEESRMVLIDGSAWEYSIYYDKETKVEYIVKENGHGGTEFTLLVDADGKPLLYGGE